MLDITRDKKNLGKTFLCRRILYIFRKCIWKILIYIITFAFQLLCVADYLKCIDETITPMEIYTGLIDSILRLIEETRYFNTDFNKFGLIWVSLLDTRSCHLLPCFSQPWQRIFFFNWAQPEVFLLTLYQLKMVS